MRQVTRPNLRVKSAFAANVSRNINPSILFIYFEMANLAVYVTVLVLAVWIREGESVRCWTCSSDLDATCNDPFLAGQPSNAYRFTLTNCDANAAASYPYLTSSKSVCKKQKKYVNGQLVITRGCTWKRADDYTNTCPSVSNNRAESTAYCETCEYDACNGAGATGYFIALLAAPLGLLLFK